MLTTLVEGTLTNLNAHVGWNEWMAAKITAVGDVGKTLLGSASELEWPKPPLWLGGLLLLLDGAQQRLY